MGEDGSGRRHEDTKPVRVGIVGAGNRGFSHVRTLLDVPGVEIPAICDLSADLVTRSQDAVEQAGRRRPDGYSGGVEEYRRLVDRADLRAPRGDPRPW